MISIFNGRSRTLGEGATSQVYLQVSVDFRDYLDRFRGAELFVFMAIALHSNEAGWGWPSYEKLAEETGYGRDTVARALSNLCKMELQGKRVLLRTRFRDDGGTLGVNHYLVFPSRQELERYDDQILPVSERLSVLAPRMDFPYVAKPYMENPDDNNNHIEQEPSDDDGIHQRLTALGVHDGQAKKLAAECPASVILGWIQYIRRNGHGLSNVPGFLVSKLRSGEAPPLSDRAQDDGRRYLAEGTRYEGLIEH